MDVTLIVPVHSRIPGFVEPFMGAVASLRTTGFLGELIIVADCCTAPVVQRIRNYGNKLTGNALNPFALFTLLEVSFQNPDKSRQAAFQLAAGRYVAFLDDDTLPNRDWLASGFLHAKTNQAVTGPVRHPNRLMGSLVAVMDFGEFRQREIPHFIANAPGCNLIFKKKLISRYPSLSFRYGGDRTVAAKLVSKLNGKILYHPDLEIRHSPDLALQAVFQREYRYGQVAVAARLNNPSIPWHFLLKTGGMAPFLLASGRLAMDIKRVVTGNDRFFRKLLMLPALFFLRIPYFLGVIQAILSANVPQQDCDSS